MKILEAVDKHMDSLAYYGFDEGVILASQSDYVSALRDMPHMKLLRFEPDCQTVDGEFYFSHAGRKWKVINSHVPDGTFIIRSKDGATTI